MSTNPPTTGLYPNIFDTTLEGTSTTKVLLQSFAMIIFSEIGDKTFLIAAILSMRHPRFVVFSGAFAALLVMSILSAMLGHVLPSLIPRKWTQIAAAVLFLVFGAKMLSEARNMESGNGKVLEEMREAEEEIEEDEAGMDDALKPEHIRMKEIEEGQPSATIPPPSIQVNGEPTTPITPEPLSKKKETGIMEGLRNFCSFFLGPVFVQAFVLTFLGEWGDRSQIATIALGAAHNVYLVSLGTIIGHSCCTALAVIGGRYVSTKISVKQVTFAGAFLFLLFGVIYFYEAFSVASSADVEIEMGIGMDGT